MWHKTAKRVKEGLSPIMNVPETKEKSIHEFFRVGPLSLNTTRGGGGGGREGKSKTKTGWGKGSVRTAKRKVGKNR